jgi:N-acetylneuraminic acid mutarotase
MDMPMFKSFAGALLLGGALFAAAAFAQSIGRWTTGAPMPSARTEVAVAEVGGKIYVVGGYRGERELEVYDPVADRWSRGASIARALHHTAAVGLKDKLYVVGGFVEGWTPTDEVHEYDPATDRWQRLAALPTPRGALAAAVLDGKIYAVGGVGWRGRNTPAHEVYDPAANRWTALAHVPTVRDHLAAAGMDGRLYAVGGRIDGNYSRNLTANEAYDPATDRWEHRAQRYRGGGARSPDVRVRGRGTLWHLQPSRSLRRQKQRPEQACAHADGATRPRRGGDRGTDLRHFGRADARRLRLGR